VSFPCVVFPSSMTCVLTARVGEAEEEEANKPEPEPVPSFTEAHTTFESVKSFFYTHKQNN
jgi:hypothetical protein